MHRPAPSLVFVFATILLDVLGFGLLIPVMPRLIAVVGGLPAGGAEHEASIPMMALVVTYAVMQFVFAPILGSLSDQFGRRVVLLVALLGSALDYFAASQAPAVTGSFGATAGLAFLFVTRMINGISGATIPVCSAYIADITPPEKRAAGFGILGAAFGLGFVFGPLLGGVLGDSTIHIPLIGPGDVRYPYIAAGVLTLINFTYGFFILPESLPQEHRRPFSWRKANPAGALVWITGHKVVRMIAATLFISNIAQFGLHTTWVLSMQNRFGWTPWYSGLSMFVVGFSAAIVQGGLARRVIPALGERFCLVGGIVLGVFAFAGYGLATHGWMIYAIIAVASIGGLAGPAAQAMTSKAVPPNEQGLLQGALAGLNSIAYIIGPIIAGTVFHHFTAEEGPTPYPGAGAPFLVGSALIALSLVPVAMIWSRMPSAVREKPVENGG